MNSFLKICIFMVLALVGAICVEQILYRFSEGYAKMRTDFLRNLNEGTAVGRFLQILPFDQLVDIPVHDGEASLPEKLDAETHYVHSLLSHTRAMRDTLYDELVDPITLPAELPSQVMAKKESALYLQIPTGKDVKVKATILRVLNSRLHQDGSLAKLDQQVAPMIRQGFACGILYADTADELRRRVDHDLPAAVNKLAVEDKRFVRRILAWGEGTSANILAQAATNSPDTFSVLALDSPVETMYGEPPVNGPLVLFLTDEKTRNHVTVRALEWVGRLRKGHMNPSTHRYSGMLVSTNAKVPESAHYKLALIYGFMAEVERLLPAFAPLSAPHVSHVEYAPERKEEPLLPAEPIEPIDPETLYDCETLVKYRQWKGADPNWLQLNNTDLILVLGKSFESQDGLDRIRKDDPDFVEFYDTLKLVHNPIRDNGSNEAEAEFTGPFATPEASVKTFIRAAVNKDVKLLSQCFAEQSAGEFRKIRSQSASKKDYDELAEMFKGAEVIGVERVGQKAEVKVKLPNFRRNKETLRMLKTPDGWKIQDF